MASNYTLMFGTYTFSNQTFEIVGHQQGLDVPTIDIRRKNGGVTLTGYESPRKITINGTIFSTDKDSLNNEANIMFRALRNRGQEAALQYRADRFITARIDKSGLDFQFRQKLYEYVYDVKATFIAQNPYAENIDLRIVTGSLYNGVTTETITNNGTRPTRGLFTFVSGASFTNDLRVDVPANSHYFNFAGPLLNGQTLIVDCDAGSVMLQSGSSFVDAISYFGGNLFLEIPEGGAQSVIINGATLSYNIQTRDRYEL
jgi:hypothetical protein